MPSTAIQATTRVTFRVSGTKPSPVLVFAKGGRKWIVASEVCRILGLRTDTVPQLVPEQERSRAHQGQRAIRDHDYRGGL